MTWTWDATHWIYWVGPLLGSLLAISFYTLIKALEYEMANPGQDSDDIDAPSPQQTLQTRQQEVRNRLLNALGYDPRISGEYDLERLQLGSRQMGYRNQKPLFSTYTRDGEGGERRSLHAAGEGNAPHFGSLGTPIRRSGEERFGERMSMREVVVYESGGSAGKKGRSGDEARWK